MNRLALYQQRLWRCAPILEEEYSEFGKWERNEHENSTKLTESVSISHESLDTFLYIDRLHLLINDNPHIFVTSQVIWYGSFDKLWTNRK